MRYDMEYKGASRKSLLMYFLQLPFCGGIAEFLNGFKPHKHYLLIKFFVANFKFFKGPELVHKMKSGEILEMKTLLYAGQRLPGIPKIHDKYTVALYYKNTMIGHIPRSDNKHIFRLLEQGKKLICTIIIIDTDVETWYRCKVKVELVG